MKPRIYIEMGNWPTCPIWRGVNPYTGKDWALGAVRLFSLEEAIHSYFRKLRRAQRRAQRGRKAA